MGKMSIMLEGSKLVFPKPMKQLIIKYLDLRNPTSIDSLVREIQVLYDASSSMIKQEVEELVDKGYIEKKGTSVKLKGISDTELENKVNK